MFERNRVLTSAGQFLDAIVELVQEWTSSNPQHERPPIWFRGQARQSTDWPLQPKLYRVGNANEFEVRRHFARRHKPFLGDPLEVPPDRWHEYYMMQHYGAATRLLDWTEGALLGLYFALRDASRFAGASCDAAVYALHPLTLNQSAVGHPRVMYTEMEQASPYLPESLEVRELPVYPIALAPDYSTRRIIAQRGVFTLHGSCRSAIDTLADNGLCDLVEFVVPQEHAYVIG